MENARCGELSVLLDQLEDLIEDAKSSFLSGKVAVDKNDALVPGIYIVSFKAADGQVGAKKLLVK